MAMAYNMASMGLPPGMYYSMPGDSGMPSTQSAFPGMQQPTMMPVAAHSRGIPQSLPRTMTMPVQTTTIDNTFYTSFPQTSVSAVKSTPLYQPRQMMERPNQPTPPPQKQAVTVKTENPTPTKKSKKRLKDPNAPKKPPPAFLKWSIEERGEIKKVLGNISPSEMSKELGHRWGVLNPEIKEFYKQRYSLEKIEYDKAKAAFIPNGDYVKPVTQRRRTRKTKKFRDPAAPRKPPPAFLKWAMEERNVIKAEVGPLKPGDMGKELGRRWAQLNPQVKLHFQERYKEEKKEYDILRGKYEPSKRALALLGKTALKKPPPTFLKWSMFERVEIKKELGNLSFTEMGKELGRRWAAITPEVKAVYKEKYEQEKLEYEAQCNSGNHGISPKVEQQDIMPEYKPLMPEYKPEYKNPGQTIVYKEQNINLSSGKVSFTI